jgi:hypothetical protein
MAAPGNVNEDLGAGPRPECEFHFDFPIAIDPDDIDDMDTRPHGPNVTLGPDMRSFHPGMATQQDLTTPRESNEPTVENYEDHETTQDATNTSQVCVNAQTEIQNIMQMVADVSAFAHISLMDEATPAHKEISEHHRKTVQAIDYYTLVLQKTLKDFAAGECITRELCQSKHSQWEKQAPLDMRQLRESLGKHFETKPIPEVEAPLSTHPHAMAVRIEMITPPTPALMNAPSMDNINEEAADKLHDQGMVELLRKAGYRVFAPGETLPDPEEELTPEQLLFRRKR